MNRSVPRRPVVLACAVPCALLVAMSLWIRAGSVRTEDQNGDGRPDVWRTYDRQGQLSEVSIDTNFDGRSDVREYYERRGLVRRESDRDFNGRVDLVQEFEPTTHEPVRSLVDVDFDGTADLMVLFQGGQPVLSRRARQIVPAATSDPRLHAAVSPQTADDRLAPFEDPFRMELALRAVRTPIRAGDWIGLSTSGGLPSSPIDVVGPVADSTTVPGSSVSRPSSANVLSYSPRGPPPSLPLA
jgi:hypothetical protein